VLEKFDGAEIVYGDSVTGDTEVVIRTIDSDNSMRLTIEEVLKRYTNASITYNSDKEHFTPTIQLETYSDIGWTKIKHIMRHYTNKIIYLIETNTGCVKVTADHSCILGNGTIIKPTELKPGDKLLTCDNNNIVSGIILKISNITPATPILVYDFETGNHHFQAGDGNIVVHNTDSIFIDFHAKDTEGRRLTGKVGLKKSIDLGVEAENYIQQFLKPPHRLEYEKTFWPFILFSKKRYIGYKYEFDLDNYKETSMGIVMKRRDNANIVKFVYGRVMDTLLKERDLAKSIKILKDDLHNLLDGKFPMDMLVITKSLKGFYKNPTQIAHKVLADRMGDRDPGNKPMSNDRIPYAYIEKKNAKLQGDKIEHTQYIIDNKLKLDYAFYITNQIMKPVGQIFALIAEDLPGFNKGDDYYKNKRRNLLNKFPPNKADEKIQAAKFDDATDLIFGEVLRKATNRKNKTQAITNFFSVKKN
jgi:hypothetical protein